MVNPRDIAGNAEEEEEEEEKEEPLGQWGGHKDTERLILSAYLLGSLLR